MGNLSEGASTQLSFLRLCFPMAANKRDLCLKLHACQLCDLLILNMNV